jgi:Predicted integral membrane protein
MMYWDRPTLKTRSKDVLKKSYWMSLLVAAVCSLFGYLSSFTHRDKIYEIDFYNFHWLDNGWEYYMRLFLPAFAGLTVFIGLLGLFYRIFVVNALEVGSARFYTLCRYESVTFKEIFYGFKNGRYLDNVKTMFMRDLYTFLWSLLFIVPGIVKYFSYWMIPYILAENPNISTERAFEISKQTTNGEKGRMFVLCLSFFGWYLLAGIANILTFGLATLALTPYPTATFAELYGALRVKAVKTGICNRDEIGADIEE